MIQGYAHKTDDFHRTSCGEEDKLTNTLIQTEAETLLTRHEELHKALDKVETTNLSQIKEISKRIHFADIGTPQQAYDNTGDVYYKLNLEDRSAKRYKNLTLDYTIKNNFLGMFYGTFSKSMKKGEEVITYSSDTFNSYAKFITDIVANKVVYSHELENFVKVHKNHYIVIDDIIFSREYPVKKDYEIKDFLNVFTEMFKNDHVINNHNYTIHTDVIAGNDWTYSMKLLSFEQHEYSNTDLFAIKYDVDAKDINLTMAKSFLEMIVDNKESLNNIKLLHAYVMMRKLDLVPAEKYFLLKDFGRSGKGLLLESFEKLVNVRKVNYDALTGNGFELANEWINFYGADVAHANETGAITEKEMRVLRKIATGENVTGRLIQKNSVSFDIRSVLILDTNEPVDIGGMTGNTTRTVKIALKDRSKDETDIERHQNFSPYWEFIKPNGKHSTAAAISFLMVSLEYLSECGGVFEFGDVTLKNYHSLDQLTETQQFLLLYLSKQEFIPTGNDELQKHITLDYGDARTKKFREDMKKIGVSVSKGKKVDGTNIKVREICNDKLFNLAYELTE